MPVTSIVLNNGQQMPSIGLGTFQIHDVGNVVKHAIDIGYRHFDCAMLYLNEAEIGAAIREKIAEGVVKREDLFIVTKLWNAYHDKELVVPTCKQSLQNFGLDYIDLYLIHWPMAQEQKGFKIEKDFVDYIGKDYDYVETWKGMEECLKLGLTKGIGLSNFNSKQIQRVLDVATIKPVLNQVEAHLLLNQKKLTKFCNERNIAVAGYAPFGSPARTFAKPEEPVVPLNEPKILNIGKKYGKTGPQVILRYLIDIGVTPLPKASTQQRLAENFNVFDFQLTSEEIATLDGLDCNGRLFTIDSVKDVPHYPFDEEY